MLLFATAIFVITNIAVALIYGAKYFLERTRAMRPDDTPGYWLMQTMRSVANAFSEVLQTTCATLGKPYVITPPQWFALGLLTNEQDLPIGNLAQRLALDASVVTGIVKRLEQHGLIERVHDRADYRLVRLHLTVEGEEITHALADTVAAFNQRLLQGVSPKAKEMLFQQLALIRANAASILEEASRLDTSEV